MKISIIYILLLSFLLQSCYSYRSIGLTNSYLAIGKKYKIKQSNKYEKIKFKSFTDDSIIVSYGKTEKQMAKTDILEIKEREFSKEKTVFFAMSTVLGFVGLSEATYKSPPINYLGNTNFPK